MGSMWSFSRMAGIVRSRVGTLLFYDSAETEAAGRTRAVGPIAPEDERSERLGTGWKTTEGRLLSNRPARRQQHSPLASVLTGSEGASQLWCQVSAPRM